MTVRPPALVLAIVSGQSLLRSVLDVTFKSKQSVVVAIDVDLVLRIVQAWVSDDYFGFDFRRFQCAEPTALTALLVTAETVLLTLAAVAADNVIDDVAGRLLPQSWPHCWPRLPRCWRRC